jgi:hypothetical protein
MEEQRSWEEEDFETQKRRNEELIGLQREQFELQKKHFEEDREMQQRFHEEDRQLEAERLQKQQEFYYAGRELEDQRIEMERENWQKQYQWSLDAYEKAGEYNKEMDKLQDQYRELQEKQEDTIAAFQKLLLYEDESRENVRDIVDAILKLAGGLGGAVPGTPGSSSGNKKQFGGPIMEPTLALLGEAGEEYVVPRGGALVKTDDRSIAVLGQILEVLQSIHRDGKDIHVSVIGSPATQAQQGLSLEDQSYANWPR